MNDTTVTNSSSQHHKYKLIEKLSHIIIITAMFAALVLSCIAMVTIPTYRESVQIVSEFAFVFAGMAIATCLYVSCSLDARQEDKSNRIFRNMLVCIFLLLMMELFICYTEGNNNLAILNNLMAYVSYLINVARAYLLWIYFSSIIRPEERHNVVLRRIIYLGIGAELPIFLLNPFLHHIFWIDEYGFYQRGSMEWLSYLPHFMIWTSLIIMAFLEDIDHRIRYLLLGCILSSSIFCLINYFILREDYFIFLADEIVLVLIYSNIYVQRGWAIERQHTELAEAQMNLMKSQINPHFVYNTLASISGLCYSDPELAAELIDHFSDYLRENFEEMISCNVIPFERELEYLDNYLAIETVRFPGIEVVYDLQVMDFDLPSISLQPLVENAIRHGIRRKIDGRGTITISSYETAGAYVVRIQDDGVGFEKPSFRKEGERNRIGIQNVRKRLQLLYNGTLNVDSVPGQGTVCTLTIPKGNE